MMLNLSVPVTSSLAVAPAISIVAVRDLKQGDVLFETKGEDVRGVFIVRDVQPSKMVNIMLCVKLVAVSTGEVFDMDLSKTTTVFIVRPVADD